MPGSMDDGCEWWGWVTSKWRGGQDFEGNGNALKRKCQCSTGFFKWCKRNTVVIWMMVRKQDAGLLKWFALSCQSMMWCWCAQAVQCEQMNYAVKLPSVLMSICIYGGLPTLWLLLTVSSFSQIFQNTALDGAEAVSIEQITGNGCHSRWRITDCEKTHPQSSLLGKASHTLWKNKGVKVKDEAKRCPAVTGL